MCGLDPRIHLKKTFQEDGLPGQARQRRIFEPVSRDREAYRAVVPPLAEYAALLRPTGYVGYRGARLVIHHFLDIYWHAFILRLHV
jgi:hypothetical protein